MGQNAGGYGGQGGGSWGGGNWGGGGSSGSGGGWNSWGSQAPNPYSQGYQGGNQTNGNHQYNNPNYGGYPQGGYPQGGQQYQWNNQQYANPFPQGSGGYYGGGAGQWNAYDPANWTQNPGWGQGGGATGYMDQYGHWQGYYNQGAPGGPAAPPGGGGGTTQPPAPQPPQTVAGPQGPGTTPQLLSDTQKAIKWNKMLNDAYKAQYGQDLGPREFSNWQDFYDASGKGASDQQIVDSVMSSLKQFGGNPTNAWVTNHGGAQAKIAAWLAQNPHANVNDFNWADWMRNEQTATPNQPVISQGPIYS
jgi:hypothetical protein